MPKKLRVTMSDWKEYVLLDVTTNSREIKLEFYVMLVKNLLVPYTGELKDLCSSILRKGTYWTADRGLIFLPGDRG